MIKTALKFNIVLFMLILIVSMPLVYADWSDLTVTVDTNVVTYDEIAFIQQYRGLYYIEYIGNKPYIMTDENILYNQYMVTDYDIQPVNLDYEIEGDLYYLYPRETCQSPSSCHLGLRFRVDSDDYYIIIDGYYLSWVNAYGIRNNISELIRGNAGDRPLYVNARGYDFIRLSIHGQLETPAPPSFRIIIYKSDNVIERINRQAQTYTYERSDYTRIGAIILDSYNQFVDSLLNPLDTITGWLKDLANYIWSAIKRIIDPEGIFLK